MLMGVITRYNRKTVTVVTDGGARWNVASGLLRLIEDAGSAGEGNRAVALRGHGR
jgi:hypothetical protein